MTRREKQSKIDKLLSELKTYQAYITETHARIKYLEARSTTALRACQSIKRNLYKQGWKE